MRPPQSLEARGCHVVRGRRGVWALHPGLLDVLSTPNLGSWGVIEAVGREMSGEVGSARILEIFVKYLIIYQAGSFHLHSLFF